MADEEKEPVVEEPVVVPDVAAVEPRRSNKAVIGLTIGLVILCVIIIYFVFFDKKRGARNNYNYNNRSRLPILNSRTISDNGGYGGSFSNNTAKNFRV